MKLYEKWMKIWLYIISILAGGALFLLIFNGSEMTFQQIALGLTVIVLYLHIMEEGVIPGGFYFMYNTLFATEEDGNSLLDRYPMNRFMEMLSNFLGMILSTVFFLFFPNNSTVIVWFLVSCVEVFAHTVTGLKMKKKLANKGKKTIYCPGYFTTIFGFLPLAIYILVGLINAKPTLIQIVIGILLGIASMLININLPEKYLRDKNTRFVFDKEFGYFKKYIEDSNQ